VIETIDKPARCGRAQDAEERCLLREPWKFGKPWEGGGAAFPTPPLWIELEGGVGERSQLAHLFELTSCYGVTLIALAADWSGGSPFPSSNEACGACNLIGTTLRPLTSPRKSGSTGAQPSGLGAHFVTFPRLLKNYTVRHGGDMGVPVRNDRIGDRPTAREALFRP
jgi:hypothetical protein